MKTRLLTISALTLILFGSVSCFKKGKTKGAIPDNGQLMGVSPNALGGMGKAYWYGICTTLVLSIWAQVMKI
jgi:hypothetical protein